MAEGQGKDVHYLNFCILMV